jgi:Flp pilus assembly protein TadD
MQKQLVQRILIIASGLVFVGLMGFPLIGMFNNSSPTSSQNANQQNPALTPAATKQLEEQAQGYEQVLKREPENTTALAGLAKARLQLQDWQAAIVPLEKLAITYPKQPGIWQAIAQSKIRLGDINGAIAATEKLVKLEPQNKEYQNVLKVLKQQATGDNAGASPKAASPSPSPSKK